MEHEWKQYEWLLTEDELHKAEAEAKAYYDKYHPLATADFHDSMLAIRLGIARAEARKFMVWLCSNYSHVKRPHFMFMTADEVASVLQEVGFFYDNHNR